VRGLGAWGRLSPAGRAGFRHRAARWRQGASWHQEARRLVVLAVLVPLAVAGTLVGTQRPAPEPGTGPSPASSLAEPAALSSSWSCAGATAGPASTAPGTVVLDNSGPQPLTAEVQLVGTGGQGRDMSVVVPAGGTRRVAERLPGAPWVGALVTFYGGMALAVQQVSTPHGVASQPCAARASAHWYFPEGATLRNADEYVALLNPYPLDAVADLSFFTEQGPEQPAAFQGVVVPAHGLVELDLRSHLRRRQHIALSVSTRGGGIVAFETEVVSPVPPGAPLLGSKGAPDPVLPVAGAELLLGASAPSVSWWWPQGADGAGLHEAYVVYDPGPRPARVRLDLVAMGVPGASASAGSTQLVVAPGSATLLTTNGEPWALAGAAYSVHLQSLNGAPVVAERALTAGAPSAERGRASILGEGTPATSWLVPPSPPEPVAASPLPHGAQAAHHGGRAGTGRPKEARSKAGAGRAARTSRGRQAASQARRAGVNPTRAHRAAAPRPGQAWLWVADPGPRPATVELGPVTRGTGGPRWALVVEAGRGTGVALPPGLAGQGLRATSSQPVLVEEGTYAGPGAAGINLAPAVPLGTG